MSLAKKDLSSEKLKEILLEKAQKASQHAYAPYSKFHVGAALVTESGNIYEGCNVENISYGLTSCAERNAIFQAIAAEGPSMRFKTIVVTTHPQVPCTPCGACRQVMAEFATSDSLVIYKTENHTWGEATLKTMLPESFIMDSSV